MNMKVLIHQLMQFDLLVEVNEGECILQKDRATAHIANTSMEFSREFFGNWFI